MSFYEYAQPYKKINVEEFFQKVSDQDILRILSGNKIGIYDFLTLLSPKAEKYLEQMAQKANQLSIQHFGKTILLFTPIYISNYCVNRCAYCSYNIANEIHRKSLTMEEIEAEAQSIAKTGLKHILLLTGESKKEASIPYIKEAVQILKKYFDSVAIEIYPLTEEEYGELVEAGVDGLTVYQETYNEEIYDRIHIAGPKKNYKFRLDAPERGCKAKIRTVNIGALLGLTEWRKEAFLTGLHGQYLQNKYTDVEVSVSLPRIRPHVGAFNEVISVSDRNLVQILLAMRIFMPRAGATLSTRESAEFRDNLIGLGITKMSAGVTTEVGGHALENKGDSQFEISDSRSVREMKEAIIEKGYQPIFKDWMQF